GCAKGGGKPPLPKMGKCLESAIPAVMAAARSGEVTFEDDGSVTLGGVTLAPDEVEIQATPRPGTAVADRDGLVVVLDTALTPELRAEGDARELARGVQDLRREAGLELDDRIELWTGEVPEAVAAHLPALAADTLATIARGDAPSDASRATIELDGGPVEIALRRAAGSSRCAAGSRSRSSEPRVRRGDGPGRRRRRRHVRRVRHGRRDAPERSPLDR